MDFDLLSGSILIYILRISFEAYQDISTFHDLQQFYFILNNSLFLAQILQPEKILLIRVIKIRLVGSPRQSYAFDLFFIKSLIGQFAIVL